MRGTSPPKPSTASSFAACTGCTRSTPTPTRGTICSTAVAQDGRAAGVRDHAAHRSGAVRGPWQRERDRQLAPDRGGDLALPQRPAIDPDRRGGGGLGSGSLQSSPKSDKELSSCRPKRVCWGSEYGE